MENKKIVNKEIKINKEKILDIVNKFFNSIWFPIFIGVILLLKTIFFYNDTITIRESIDKNLVFGTSIFIVTFICIICVLPNKARTISTIVLNLLLSILLVSDNLYYTYSSSVLSIAQMTNLQ